MSTVGLREIPAQNLIPYRLKIIDGRHLELISYGAKRRKWSFTHDGFSIYEELRDMAYALFPYGNITGIDFSQEVHPEALLTHYRGFNSLPGGTRTLLMAEQALIAEMSRTGRNVSTPMELSEMNLEMLASFHLITFGEFQTRCCRPIGNDMILERHAVCGDQAWMVEIPEHVDMAFITSMLNQADILSPGKLRLVQSWKYNCFVCAHYKGATVWVEQHDGNRESFALSAPMELSYNHSEFMVMARSEFVRVCPYEKEVDDEAFILMRSPTPEMAAEEQGEEIALDFRPICVVAPMPRTDGEAELCLSSVALVRSKMQEPMPPRVSALFVDGTSGLLGMPMLKAQDFVRFVESDLCIETADEYAEEDTDSSYRFEFRDFQRFRSMVVRGEVNWAQLSNHILAITDGGSDGFFAHYCCMWGGITVSGTVGGGRIRLL